MNKRTVIASEPFAIAQDKLRERSNLNVIRDCFVASLLTMTAMLMVAGPTEAIDPADNFIVQDIEYQSFDGMARLNIETNDHVDYVIYELEDPYRIVIDPLDTVWCDFEEEVYFDEGMVRSIKFVRSRGVPEGPGLPYYPFDFVTIQPKYPCPYKLSEDHLIITLNLGEEITPQTEMTTEVNQARMIEEEFIEEFVKKDWTEEEETLDLIKDKMDKERLALEEEKKELEEEEVHWKEELIKEGREVDRAKEELEKEKLLLVKEKARIAKEKGRLEKDKTRLERREEKLKETKKEFKPRPVKDLLKEPLAKDYLTKVLTLDDCIQIAMSNSLSIKVAKERVKLAKLKVNEAFRELFPEFSLLWDESRGMISEEHYRGRKYGFEFKQALFHGGENMYLWEQAKKNLKATKESLSKGKEEIIFDVSKAYYELAKAGNKYNFQKTLLEDANADFEIAKKEYEFGLISQIDFMNIESAINQITHTLLTHHNNFSLAKLELNKVMNIDIDIELKIDSGLKLKEIDIDLQKCMELALKFKPEYRISYLNTEVAKLTEKIAKSQTYPQVDIFGKYLKATEKLQPRNLGTNLDNERVLGATVSVPWGPHTLDYQKKIVKLAPTVTTYESDTRYNIDKLRVNLFDNMGRSSNIKDASVSYKQALDELNKAEQDIHTDIREAIFNFREASIKVENSLNNIELYNKELEVADIKKGLNEISFYELIQAKIKLYAEKGTYTDGLGDYYIAVARVNKAIGLGGYFK